MSWLNWLEHRVGFLAIPRLIPTIAVLNVFVYLLALLQPTYIAYLSLEPGRILHGEIWRLFSYVFIPQLFLPHGAPDGLQAIMLLFYIWMLIWIGNSLEHAWGAFRLTVFYLLGMLAVTVVAFLLNWGQSDGNASPFYLNTSLFFAFASVFPNVRVYVMMIFPLRIKWIAFVSLGLLLLVVLMGDWLDRISITSALLNYILFFFPAAISGARQRRHIQGRRMRFTADSARTDEPLHQCAVCKRTERDDADLEFRVAANGEEYCLEHLPALTRSTSANKK